jgi:hypothetical protein
LKKRRADEERFAEPISTPPLPGEQREPDDNTAASPGGELHSVEPKDPEQEDPNLDDPELSDSSAATTPRSMDEELPPELARLEPAEEQENHPALRHRSRQLSAFGEEDQRGNATGTL